MASSSSYYSFGWRTLKCKHDPNQVVVTEMLSLPPSTLAVNVVLLLPFEQTGGKIAALPDVILCYSDSRFFLTGLSRLVNERRDFEDLRSQERNLIHSVISQGKDSKSTIMDDD